MIPTAHNTVKCRICDAFLGRYHAYVMTPEQTLTQTADTPPCHRDCAIKDAEYASAQTSEVRAVWTTKVLPEIGNDEMTGHVQFRHLELPHSIQWISPDGKPTTYAELEAAFMPAMEVVAARAKSREELQSIEQQIADLHKFMPYQRPTKQHANEN